MSPACIHSFSIEPFVDPNSMCHRRFLLHRDNFVVHIIIFFTRSHKLLILILEYFFVAFIFLLRAHIIVTQWMVEVYLQLACSFVQWLINFGLSFVHYSLRFIIQRDFELYYFITGSFYNHHEIQLILFELHNKLIHRWNRLALNFI